MRFLLVCVVACVLRPESSTASTAAETAVAEARGLAGVWDEVLNQLPVRAKALSLAPPTLTDITLSKAMGGDLRMQLITWSNAHMFGRCWLDGLDEIPRPVWILEGKTGPKAGISLVVAMADRSLKTGEPGLCPFELILAETGGRIAGEFSSPGVELESLPVSPSKGTARGARMPLPPLPPQPVLRATVDAGPGPAMRTVSESMLFLRLWRALDIALTQPVSRPDAWTASLFVPPAPVAPAPVAVTGKALKTMTADDLLDREKEGDAAIAPAATSTPSQNTAKADPAAEARLSAITDMARRARVASTAWAKGLTEVRSSLPVAEEAAADSDFGPWFGAGCLETNGNHANVIPADAGTLPGQKWLFARNWTFVGPFPHSHTNIISRHLPEFLDATNLTYRTNLDALKKSGETFAPGAEYVTWQKGFSDPNTPGIERPPIWRGVKEEADINDSVDPSRNAGPMRGYSYARTEVFSPCDVDLWMAIGADDNGRLWVNDRLAVTTDGLPDHPERIAWGKATFRKGVNRLVARCDNFRINMNKDGGQRWEPPNYFWVKIAVQGKPLDAAAAAARKAAVEKRQSEIAHVAPGVAGFRNNNTANYPDAKPATAWDICTGQNVIWRAHLECEPMGRQYELRGPNSKAPPVVAGDRIFVLGEPHFLICLDKMTGKKLWERECNILEFTAPDKVEESRRIWSEHVAARNRLFELDRDWDARRELYKNLNKRLHPPAHFNGWAERVEVLMERGMSAEEAKQEIERRITAMNEKSFDLKRRKGEYEKFLTTHAKYGSSGWGSWTGYSFGSPVTDGHKVWVKFCTGVAACFDKDGNRLWMSRIPAEFNNYPVCCSPLLTDGKFVVEVGAGAGGLRDGYEYSMLVALDAASGKELWRSDRILQYSATGSSVAMMATDGRDDVPAIVTGGGAVVRASDGVVLFRDWKTDAGAGTPTLHGWDLYYPSYDCVLAACRLVMYDRDSIGLRRLWTRPTPCEFDGGMTYDNGILYGPGGGQRALGYVVFDAVGRRMLRHETYGTPRQGVPPWVNGRQYVPAIAAGDYLYLGEHGTKFDGPEHDGAVCAVMQKGCDGFLIAQNETEETWTAPPVADGDRIYIRTDPSLICVGHTGNDGNAYEADVNARYVLPELEVQPPEETPPIEIAPTKWRFARGGAPYSQSIAYPMTVIGPFSHTNSDAVLKAIGVENASVGMCREPEKPQAPGARLPANVAGETINGSWHESCFYENHSTARLKGLAGKGAFFSTALNNDRERVVRVWAQQEPPDIWINGQPIPEGTRVRLKPGSYALLARWATTEDQPASPGFHFRLDDSSDVAAERKAWRESLRRCKPELERIAKHGTRPAQVAKARNLLAAMGR
jgi:outer membrane protein assembly factor BamB